MLMPVYMAMRHASGSHRIDRVFHENIVLSTSGAQSAGDAYGNVKFMVRVESFVVSVCMSSLICMDGLR